MTDFIHEHPKDEQDPTAPPSPAPVFPTEEAAIGEGGGQKRVYGYILILFVVAFFLLLWSFLMNQRSNEEVLSELRGSAGTLQSTLDRNVTLEQQVDELETERSRLEEEAKTLQEQLEAAQEQAELLEKASRESAYSLYALNYLMQLERAVADGNDEWADAFIERLESASDTPRPLKEYLPVSPLYTDPDGNDGVSPAERYAQLKKSAAD